MKALLLCAAAVAITGCATLKAGLAVRNFEKAVELINSQDVEALTRHSGKPFIFDREILFRTSDIEAVWRHLSENNFSLNNPVITVSGESGDSLHKLFSDSDEMEIIFRKYIPSDAAVGAIATDNGVYMLLLGSGTEGYPSILGITGF